MATNATINSTLMRLSTHFRVERTAEATAIMLADWARFLEQRPDEAVRAAADTCIMVCEFFPPFTMFMEAVQDEQRRMLRELTERALPSGPRNDEPIADAHIGAKAIRLQIHYGLPPARDFAEMRERAETMDLPDGAGMNLDLRLDSGTRGHDHRNGATHCPVCTRERLIRAQGEQEFVVAERPVWSTCRECDGSHFVEVGPNVVVPCEVCNGHLHNLWQRGHMEPNHRCEECAPRGRARRGRRSEHEPEDD